MLEQILCAADGTSLVKLGLEDLALGRLCCGSPLLACCETSPSIHDFWNGRVHMDIYTCVCECVVMVATTAVLLPTDAWMPGH